MQSGQRGMYIHSDNQNILHYIIKCEDISKSILVEL